MLFPVVLLKVLYHVICTHASIATKYHQLFECAFPTQRLTKNLKFVISLLCAGNKTHLDGGL